MQREKPLFERQNDEFMSRIRNGEVSDYKLMEAQADLHRRQMKAHFEAQGWVPMCFILPALAVASSLSGDSNQLIMWLLAIFCLVAFALKRWEWQRNIKQAQRVFDARAAECGQCSSMLMIEP